MKRYLINIVLIIGILFGVSACQSDEKASDTSKIKVVATTGMIGDALKNILPSNYEIITLMGPGVDPHLYKATQGDLQKLRSADLIVYNGIHLEGKLTEVLAKLSQKKNVIALGDFLEQNKLRVIDNDAGVYDPHIWFDVKLWSIAIDSLGNRLTQLYVKDQAIIASRAKSINDSLVLKDLWVKKQIEQIPSNSRVLITAHDAFGYFGDRYGMEVRGLQGISTVADYGLNDITSLVDFIVERNIKAIFVESSVSQKSIQAVLDGCKLKGLEVSIGGTLYSDAMGAEGTKEGTYLGMVQYNVETIVKSLK